MAEIFDTRVDKVIRIVGTSDNSWEDAAQRAVNEAASTINDLRTATVIESDLVVHNGDVLTYRVKLEMSFQLDRSRRISPTKPRERVRRVLIIANQTLASPGLRTVMTERTATGPTEFHVLIPESSTLRMVNGPENAVDPQTLEDAAMERLLALKDADERLTSFRNEFGHLNPPLTGEVGLGDPLTTARRVMDRASFDEIVVSTLPAGISRWLKMDLPARLERYFDLPVTAITPRQESS